MKFAFVALTILTAVCSVFAAATPDLSDRTFSSGDNAVVGDFGDD